MLKKVFFLQMLKTLIKVLKQHMLRSNTHVAKKNHLSLSIYKTKQKRCLVFEKKIKR